jgi:hypothetical protein
MEKIKIKRENHVLEITENIVCGWSTGEESYLPGTSIVRIQNHEGLGWSIQHYKCIKRAKRFSDAKVIVECIRDALSMTEAIDLIGPENIPLLADGRNINWGLLVGGGDFE